MKRGDRISKALHVLVHLAQSAAVPLTSEQLATCLQTNPVVIRRAMADLRRAALVRSAPGHGGGWTLARPAPEITLHDIYTALGERLSMVPAEPESPGCLVEAAVIRTLASAYQEAEQVLTARLDQISLADLQIELFDRHGLLAGIMEHGHER